MDVVSAGKRSQMMAGIKGKNTKPELIVRKELFKRGFRYRLHGRNLPGKPDIILPKYKTTIFVNGCFWHRHDCFLFKWPKSRPEFWKEKIMATVKRDKRNHDQLENNGWNVLTIWECALKNKTNDAISIEIDKLIESLLKSDKVRNA